MGMRDGTPEESVPFLFVEVQGAMDRKPVFLTAEGQKKAQAELDYLRGTRRAEVAERIQRAKELESTANNAEYDDAKNEQAFIEGRILTVEQLLKNASIIRAERSSDQVNLGSTVTLVSKGGEEEIYTIVGSLEADPLQGRVSNESPVGQALIGKRIGEEIEVKAPAGVRRLKVLRIG